MSESQSKASLIIKRPNRYDHLCPYLAFGCRQIRRLRHSNIAVRNVLRRYNDIDDCIVHQRPTPDFAGWLTFRWPYRSVASRVLTNRRAFREMDVFRVLGLVAWAILIVVHLIGQGIKELLPAYQQMMKNI